MKCKFWTGDLEILRMEEDFHCGLEPIYRPDSIREDNPIYRPDDENSQKKFHRKITQFTQGFEKRDLGSFPIGSKMTSSKGRWSSCLVVAVVANLVGDMSCEEF